MPSRLQAVLLGMALAVALAGAACGGDTGPSLPIDEYFQRLHELDSTFAERGDELDRQIDESEDVEEIRGYMRETVDVFEAFLDGLRGLDPPESAAEAHRQAVDGLEDFISKLSDGVDNVSDAETIDELFAPFERLDTSGQEKAQEACAELERIAAGNSINVDFECGG